MKKEKTVKTHTRKTKSGKTVTVKQHTAKYDAAEQAKEIVKKAGAGAELEKVKKSKVPKDYNPYENFDFTKEEFAEWYEGTGSKADKKVEKALRKALGRKAYDELNDAAAESYKKGGAHNFFEGEVKDGRSPGSQVKKASAPKEPKKKEVKEKTPATEGKSKQPKEPREKHPRNLTDEEIKERMKKTGKYIFGRDGNIYYKMENGKRGWKISVEAYRKGLIRDHKEQNAAKSLEKYAKEYGFTKEDVSTLAGFGKSKPVRKFSQVSDIAARGYADFEDISFRTAKLELMMVSKKEHDEWVAWGKKMAKEEKEGLRVPVHKLVKGKKPKRKS